MGDDMLNDVASNFADKAEDMVGDVVSDKIQDIAGGMMDKVEGLADTVGLGDELDDVLDKAEGMSHLDLDGDGDVAGE